MKTEELRKKLEICGIPLGCYGIRQYVEGAVCLEETAEGWIVYTAERGSRHFVRRFETEEEACLCLWTEMKECAEVMRKTGTQK